MDEFGFEKLIVYHRARQLIIEVYKIIKSLPPEERFALGSQLQRSIISVVSNIVEGNGRKGFKEKIHFFQIAYASLMEAYCQLQICVDLHYMSQETLLELREEFLEVSRLINGLHNNICERMQSLKRQK